ncbi:hypothetical protein SAMN05216223_105302 [Actinacidiphila yanglinensis]|uniref:Uncharacterized protein n=1 Tax=Actinacidiphila yanglinensis TaxID=310779 RepID=A0A1H6AE81_9ACTN|nr:hypothetical protein [Actinacidiphila yanglinensis]SEG46056.1 hypothetical protein SAMN05216223_105302 [Actinacidiphila yanglinensis]
MTDQGRPGLKSLTAPATGPCLAEPAAPPTSRRAPKVAAEGVPSAVLPDQRRITQQRLIGWLHIVAPPDWRARVSATSHCACGRHLTAHGRADVLALVADHAEHRAACPLRNAPERRHAA